MRKRTGGIKKTIGSKKGTTWFERKVAELKTEPKKCRVSERRAIAGMLAELNRIAESEPHSAIPRTRRTLRERKLTAFHEAGHAVSAHLLGCRFDSVEVYTQPREESNGRLTGFTSRLDLFSVDPDIVEREVVISLAGPVAKAIKTGRSDPRYGGSDFSFALLMVQLERVGKSNFELVAYLNYLLADTMRLFSNPAVWRAVELVADGLSKSGSLTFQEVGNAIQRTGTELKDSNAINRNMLAFEQAELCVRKFLRKSIDVVLRSAAQL
jgi:hypothetical protein